MTDYHTLALHCVEGVGKDSGMVHERVSSHFMEWHIEFQPRIAYSCLKLLM